MTSVATALRPTTAIRSLTPRAARERWRTRRASAAWMLLYLNVVTWYGGSIIKVPNDLGKAVVQAALPAALLVAITANRKLTLRSNFYMCLVSLLALETTIAALDPASFGTVYRTVRLLGFVVALWLLTPWWGRNDMILVRAHLIFLAILLGVTLAGFAVDPGQAFQQSRLSGVIWPIPPPQVAHYAAVAMGLVVVLWFGGRLRGRPTAIMATATGIILIMTHTRTALSGMVAGLIVAGLSLITARARVRRFFAAVMTIGGLAVITASSFLAAWLSRGEGAGGISTLSGRTKVWGPLLSEPRSKFEILFGFGLSNSSFRGQSIDSTWLSTYLEQGLIACVICGAMLLFLLAVAYFQPPSPQRAVALFLVTYCLVASFTEDGFSDATSYLLDLTLAASCLVPYARARMHDQTRLPRLV
jgi:hypothetical protein